MPKAIYFLLGVLILLVLWTLNRGFDFSDEGVYGMLADPKQPNQLDYFHYDLFFKWIYSISGYSFSLVDLRILRLLSYFLGAYALSKFWKSQCPNTYSKLEIFSIALLFMLGGYAFLPPSLSYNSLTLVLACCWLANLYSDVSSPRKELTVGLVLAFLYYVKSPVALIVGICTLIILHLQCSKKRTWLLIPVPFFFIELLLWLSLKDNSIIRLLDSFSSLSLRPDYNLEIVIKSPLVGLFWIGLAGLVGWVSSKEFPGYGKLPLIISGITFLLLAYFTHITEEWNHLLLLLFGWIIGRELNQPKFWTQLNFTQILLWLLPFILHVGSNVYWLRIGIHYLVFWVLALPLQGFFGKRILISLGVLLTCLIVDGLVVHPFQQIPLWKQTQAWRIPGGSEVYLDPELVSILEKLKIRLEGEEELLTLYRNPGFAFLLDKRIPYHAIYWDASSIPQSGFSGFACPVIVYDRNEIGFPESLSSWEVEEIGVYQSYPVQILWKKY